jgi:hypothetical protein
LLGLEIYQEIINCYLAIARKFGYVLMICSDAIEPLFSYHVCGSFFSPDATLDIIEGLGKQRKPFCFGFYFSCRVCSINFVQIH